jgi:hypothetical protein
VTAGNKTGAKSAAFTAANKLAPIAKKGTEKAITKGKEALVEKTIEKVSEKLAEPGVAKESAHSISSDRQMGRGGSCENIFSSAAENKSTPPDYLQKPKN